MQRKGDKMQNNIKILSKSALFHGVAEENLGQLLQCLGARERSYRKGDILLLAGTRPTEIGIIVEGEAQITREDADGERAILSELLRADIFAEAYVAASHSEIPITVVAVTNCRVVWVLFEKVVTQCAGACEFHQGLIENLMRVIAEKNIAMNERMRLFSCKTTRKKILTYLKDYRDYAGTARFRIPFQRNELADYLSVDRSALSRELGKLRDEGLIRFQRNEFELTD